MAEPEGLLIEGARLATIAARDLWWRLAPPRERARLPLVRIRQRLELFLGALYVGAPSILPADPPPAPVVARSPRGARTPPPHAPDRDRRDRRRAHLAPAGGRVLRG